jgi:F-type H+-transporting ATPase subunit delta
MKTTRQIQRQAKELFRSCLVNGLVDESRARLLAQTVITSRKRGYMGLLSRFHRLVKLKADQHTAEVASAVPLPGDLQSRVKSDLDHLYGPGLAVRFVDSPELIGGMRVTVGSDVYDGSIRNRLALLQKSFSTPATISPEGKEK